MWMGEEVVAWCDAEGCVCVALAVCPHLGAALGPTAGGRVRDGCLVCPFHGFEFDVSGRCVATPFAAPPRAARLRVFETREIVGMVFAWWGIDGRPPQWDLPETPAVGSDWGEPAFRTLRFRGHPQETTENAVDLTHLRYVHGYDSVRRVEPVSANGHCFTSRFDFRRTRTVAGLTKVSFDVSACARIFGLGYSFVEIHERSIDMVARMWVLATPVDGASIDMVLVSQIRRGPRPKRPIVGLGFLPSRLRARLMNRFFLFGQQRDVVQDVVIWRQKRYRPRPALCRADGEIGIFRRYCRQFYPDHRGPRDPGGDGGADPLRPPR